MEGVRRPGRSKIGLIGGLGPRAGIFYYEEILRRRAAGGGRPELVLGHADLETVLAHVEAGDEAGLGRYLGTMANELFAAGASLVAITAVAPHMAVAAVASIARGPIVSALDAVPAALGGAGLERVAVFGTRAVMASDVFGALPRASVVRLAPSTMDRVHATYVDIARRGTRGGAGPEAAALAGAAHEAIARDGAQAILLAGTDLSSFYAGQPPTYPSLDVAALHIDAIIRRASVSEPA